MPELPEAETIARQLSPEVIGRTVREVTIASPRAVRPHRRWQEFARRVTGRRIAAVGRRGKAVLLFLNGPRPGRSQGRKQVTVVIRLGMSGQLRLCASRQALADHTRARLRLSGGRELRFIDPRQFGLLVARDGDRVDLLPEFRRCGPEPLSAGFTADYLARALSRRSARLGIALMDQRLVAGIGKIYADEICFHARLSPLRPASALSRAECQQLWRAIRRVLRSAIRFQGTSSADRAYRDAYGDEGRFRSRLMVYQRAGELCRLCETPLRRQRLTGGRGLHWCPSCQR
jgi:formamidopyrimidine-DNA glycosylase